MTRILGKLAVPFTLFFAAFVLLMAAIEVRHPMPRGLAPAAADPPAGGTSEPPSNEIRDFQQLD